MDVITSMAICQLLSARCCIALLSPSHSTLTSNPLMPITAVTP
jgi:hypothetical protein